MRRNRWVGAVLAVVALVAVACGKSDDGGTVKGSDSTVTTTGKVAFAAGSAMANIQAKGKLVVGIKVDQPGLGQKNLSGDVEGFDAEIAKIVAAGIFGGKPADAKGKIEFKEATSPNRELFIENGTVDIVVATYTINDARKQRVDFAGPYYVAAQDIMVKADDTSIKGVNDLAGKKVCSVRNSTPAGRIRTMVPQAELVEFDTYTLCKEALLDGRVQAVTTDDAILLGFASENPRALKVLGNHFSTEPYGIGLKKGDQAFRDFVNDRLEASYKNGEWAAAFDSTLGKAGIKAPQPPPVDRYAAGSVTTTTAAGGSTTSTSVASSSSTTSTTKA